MIKTKKKLEVACCHDAQPQDDGTSTNAKENTESDFESIQVPLPLKKRVSLDFCDIPPPRRHRAAKIVDVNKYQL